MTLIKLDSIQFYQPPIKADLAGKGPFISSVGDVPVVCGEGHTPTVPRSKGGWGGSLNDYDLIEVLDLCGASRICHWSYGVFLERRPPRN